MHNFCGSASGAIHGISLFVPVWRGGLLLELVGSSQFLVLGLRLGTPQRVRGDLGGGPVLAARSRGPLRLLASCLGVLLESLSAHDDVGRDAPDLCSVPVLTASWLLWDSLNGFSQVLLLELSHLQLDLSFGLLVNGSVDSQLDLLLDVGFDLPHLLSVTIDFILNWNILRFYSLWLIVSGSKRGCFLLWPDERLLFTRFTKVRHLRHWY